MTYYRYSILDQSGIIMINVFFFDRNPLALGLIQAIGLNKKFHAFSLLDLSFIRSTEE